MNKLIRAYPSITSIPEYAHMLSILETDSKNMAWVMNNFLLTRGFIPAGAPHVYNIDYFIVPDTWHDAADSTFSSRYNYAPSLSVCSLSIPEFSSIFFKNIIENVKQLIDDEFYVVLPLDVSKIDAYRITGPFLHNPLIFGYCESCEKVYMSDFVNGNKYDDFICSYKELADGYRSLLQNVERNKTSNNYWLNQCINIIRRTQVETHFDLSFFCLQLEDQISPNRAKERYEVFERGNTRKQFWGNSAYDGLISYIKLCSSQHKVCAVKPFHFIYDYAKSLRLRIEYVEKMLLTQQSAFDNLLVINDELVRRSYSLRNSVLRNQFKGDILAQDEFVNLVKQMKSQETEIIEKLLALINRGLEL